MERIVKKLFIGGTLLTALAVYGCAAMNTYAEAWSEYDRCADPTYANTEVCKDNNTPYNSEDYKYEGVFNNKSPMRDPTTTTDTSTFTLTVKEAMVLSDVYGFSITGDEISTEEINTPKITAKVGSNKDYVISLSADTPDLTSADSGNNDNIPATENVAAGVNGWGIKKQNESTYTALTSTGVTFYSGTGPTSTKDSSDQPVSALDEVEIEVGVGISPTLLPGTYETSVTLTLSAAPASGL